MPHEIKIVYDLKNENLLNLLSCSVFNPTSEKLMKRAERYMANANSHAIAFVKDNKYIGLCVFEIKEKTATILQMAVDTHERNKGIATALINHIRDNFDITEIVAETDDAIGFYLKYGFIITEITVKFETKRYVLKYNAVISHYDKLIDENNDPVYDPEPLKAYMDKWDGQVFIDKMELNKEKSVLEIGVGTGRLAVKTAPLCRAFYGIDISSKTIERAKENLADYKNINLICGDFLSFEFDHRFDVIYSSLTFMHIEDKQKAINKVYDILLDDGVFVLSIDKSQDEFIDTGISKIKIFPDKPENIACCLNKVGFHLSELFEAEFAYIFVENKSCKREQG